jgi:hypothetical protein
MVERLLYDPEGRMRVGRLIPLLGVLIFMAVCGSFLVVATTSLFTHPVAQFTWVIFVVFMLKVPLILLLWWFIRRNREWPGKRVSWSPRETREILDYLERQAGDAQSLPDGRARLTFLSREAWNVADHVEGDLKVDALTTALRIDERAGRLREGRRSTG